MAPAPTAKALLAALSAYLALALVVAWPLPLHLRTHVASQGEELTDAWQGLWTLWWVRSSLEGGESPFATRMLLHPAGTSLALHRLMPLNGWLSAPLQLAFGLVPAYNLVALLNLALCGVGAWLLARHVAGDAGSAWVAGVVFLANPRLYGELLNGTLESFAVGWSALALALLLRSLDGGTRRDACAAALCLLLQALCSPYDLVSCLVAGSVVVALRRGTLGGPAPRRLALAASVVVLLLAPLGWLLWGAAASGEYEPPTQDLLASTSADLSSFLVPSLEHARIQMFYASCYLGWSALALAAAGLAARRREAAPWAAALLVCIALALGPRVRALGVETSIPGPYRLVSSVPALGFLRGPSRFSVPAYMCLGALSSLGLSALARRRRWLIAAAPALVLAEYLLVGPVPHPAALVDASLPTAFGEVARDASVRAVVTLPIGSHRSMYAQTVHAKPMVDGYVAREPRSAGERLREVRACLSVPPAGEAEASACARSLGAIGLDLAFVPLPAGRSAACADEGCRLQHAFLERAVGPAQLCDEGGLLVFRRGGGAYPSCAPLAAGG